MQWDDFGQKVSLTARIRELIRDYPEGTGILAEQLQNADDASAKVVRFCLDHRQHGQDSLAFNSLAEFQGPALLVYNDATFAEADFKSITQIGDSLKRAAVGKTGRYGLGFNSIYHMTDLPAFVSGSWLCIFDPHCLYLPNTSAANPGKRIDYVTSKLRLEHKDQTAPFMAFGCNMEAPFNGTLFRFALRTQAMSDKSEVSKQVYSIDRIQKLLQDLQQQAHLMLLFLKSVERIEVLEWHVGENSPTLKFACALENVSVESRFERSMFRRAARALATAIPAGPSGGGNKAETVLDASEQQLLKACQQQRMFSSQYELRMKSCRYDGSREESVVERSFLVGQACAGSSSAAWKLAVEGSAEQGMSMVPWAAVALPLGVGSHNAQEEGFMFCFLPLPARSDLPAHINGTFELSSNRRNLWHGSDLMGAGKRRAMWNCALLSDLAAPLYGQLLASAARKLGSTDSYYQLWPSHLDVLKAKDPLGAIVEPLLSAIASNPVAFSGVDGGRCLAPNDATFLDDRAMKNETLVAALLTVGIPIATMPPAIIQLLVHQALRTPSILIPQILRQRLRSYKPDSVTSKQYVAALLEFAFSDIDETDPASIEEILGLSILPKLDGTSGAFGSNDSENPLFLPSEADTELLGEYAPEMLVDSAALSSEVKGRLKTIVTLQLTNLRHIDFQSASDYLMGSVMPKEWRGQSNIAWQQESAASGLLLPTRQWMKQFWQWIATKDKQDILAFSPWPILPSTRGILVAPHSLDTSVVVSMNTTPDVENVVQLLNKLDCYVVDTELINPSNTPSLKVISHDATPGGLAACLYNAYRQSSFKDVADWFSAAATEITKEEQLALRGVLLKRGWYAENTLTQQRTLFIRRLPVYSRAVQSDDEPFMSLEGKDVCLPPDELKPSEILWQPLLSNASFAGTSNKEERLVLAEYLGVPQLNKAQFYTNYLLPVIAQLQPAVREALAVQVLTELPVLKQTDAALFDLLKSAPLVATLSGSLKSPKQLHDPRKSELLLVLDPEEDFPSPAFADVLDVLVTLGMRQSADRDSILHAAQGIATVAESDPEAAIARGKALLSFLEVESGRLSAVGPPVRPQKERPGFERLFSKMTSLLGPQSSGDLASAAQSNEEANAAVAKFWQQLRDISWCPVIQQPPVAGMPWKQPAPATAKPGQVRPESDMWLCSSQMYILDADCRAAPVLAKEMGWAEALNVDILGEQLAAIGSSYREARETGTRQILAGVIPTIYRSLASLSPSQLEALNRRLADAPIIWVGDGFSSVSKVAFKGPLDLSPWLYIIPLDLAPFKDLLQSFGVQPSFTAKQYADVLASMAEEAAGAPLKGQRLEQALAIVSVLADIPLTGNIALHIPDEKGLMAESGLLSYQDAPWMEAELPEGIRFVHKRIANDTADRLGAGSLRRVLLLKGADSIKLGWATAEAFGQSEALTTRLRHILEAYADGPGVLHELIQNADDAGAGVVKFMLDKSNYATNSLLGPKMAQWQGPALVAYNDGVFSPSDLQAISRIGQDGKMGRPEATGRFGLGFNAVYHYTDVPSFVSGDLLVMFDPHATHLPGVNAAQPGLKIRFPTSPLPQQFPDSLVAPYQGQFGCRMDKRFDGTLFRFPLRTEETAARSDIKNMACSTEHVVALFQQFAAQGSEVLLFLKSVRKIELYVKEGGQEPEQIFSVAMTCDDETSQSAIKNFLKGSNTSADFLSKLSSTPDDALPKSCVPVQTILSRQDLGKTPQKQRWVVCTLLSGGRARQMTVSKGKERGWVPWAGVAAPIHSNSDNNHESVINGRAFCFLPLPAHTGLPIHVNGAFELSSNRRDLWFGNDLTGGGKDRALWNAALLADGAAVAYAQLLEKVTATVGNAAECYRLWPDIGKLSAPWSLLASAVYKLVLSKAVVWSDANGGSWEKPSEAVFMGSDIRISAQIQAALVAHGWSLVQNIPEYILKGLLAANADLNVLDINAFATRVLPAILPGSWHGKRSVPLQSTTTTGEEQPPLTNILDIWETLSSNNTPSQEALLGLQYWPLVPCQAVAGEILCALHPESSLILEGSWSETVSSALFKLGCAFPLLEAVKALPRWAMDVAIKPSTAAGVLQALQVLLKHDHVDDVKNLSAGEKDALRNFLLQQRWFDDGSLSTKEIELLKQLPIFRCCGPEEAFTAINSAKVYVQPPKIEKSALPPCFVEYASAGKAKLLTEYLGVREISWDMALQDYVLPRAEELSNAATETALFPLLQELATSPNTIPATVIDSLKNTAFVPISSDDITKLKPSELYDARSDDLRQLLGAEGPYPAQSWASNELIMSALVVLGLKTSLDADALLGVALHIEKAALAGNSEVADIQRRGKALMQALDTLPPTTPDAFWTRLSLITFVPVHVECPVESLPWPQSTDIAVAAPKMVRPITDAWMVSSTTRLLYGECSENLAHRLGWDLPPPTATLIGQLLELGKAAEPYPEEVCSDIQTAVQKMYAILNEPSVLDSPASELIKVSLDGSRCFWVGDRFVTANEVALETSRDLRPYIYSLPNDFTQYQGLLTLLNVPAVPAVEQYAAALSAMAVDFGGEQQLTDETLALAVVLADGLALAASSILASYGGKSQKKAIIPTEKCYLPDAQGILAPSASLYYDDAAWLSQEGLRMVHHDISAETAEALGAHSLRYHHQLETQTTSSLPCPPASLIKQMLEAQADPAVLALWDIIELADASGCQAVEVLLDTHSYPAQSLLQPGLAGLQGPAICVKLLRTKLTMDELIGLQSPPTPYRLRFMNCQYGHGLMNCYTLTDCLQIVSDALYFFDPAGKHVIAEGGGPKAPDANDALSSGVGRQYRFLGSDLPTRFADQFRPFDLSSSKTDSGNTLIRLPLRMQHTSSKAAASKQVESVHSDIWSIDQAKEVVDEFSSKVASTMPFLQNIRTVRVSRQNEPGNREVLLQVRLEASLLVSSTQSQQQQNQQQRDSVSAEQRTWFDEREWRKSSSTGGGFFGQIGKQLSRLGTNKDESKDEGIAKVIEHRISVKSQGKNEEEVQRWVVGVAAGAGGSASIATDKRYAGQMLNPQSAVAVLVTRDKEGNPTLAANIDGLSSPLPLPNLGPLQHLPFVLCAKFALSRASGRRPVQIAPFVTAQNDNAAMETTQQVLGRFNRSLLKCAASATSELLKALLQIHQGSSVAGFYQLLPNKLPSDVGFAEDKDLYTDIFENVARKPVWQLRTGSPVPIAQGCFLAEDSNTLGDLSEATKTFIQHQFPLLDVPSSMRRRLEAWGVQGLRTIVPSVMRQLIKQQVSLGQLTRELFSPQVAAELLSYCTSDVLLSIEEGHSSTSTTSAAATGDSVVAGVSASTNGTAPSMVMNGGQQQNPYLAPNQPPPAPFITQGQLNAPPEVLAAVNAAAAGVQSLLTNVAGFLNEQQQQGAVAESSVPVNLDALREIKGLPYITSNGFMQLLGNQPAYIADPELDLAPLFADHPSVLKQFLHPCISSKLQQCLRHPQVAASLRVEQYTMTQFSAHLGLVLPSHWAPAGIGRDVPVSVDWADGRKGGPTPEWLQQLWSLLLKWQDALQLPVNSRWDALAGWALLPCCEGKVVRLLHRHVVITPPVVVVEQQEGSSGSGAVFEEPWQTKLVPAFIEMGALILDPRFSVCADECNTAYTAETTNIDAIVLRKLKSASDLGILKPDYASTAARDAVRGYLEELAAGPYAASILQNPLTAEFTRQLSIFVAFNGSRVALDTGMDATKPLGYCSQDATKAVLGTSAVLPPSVQLRLLKDDAPTLPLYGALGLSAIAGVGLLSALLKTSGAYGQLAGPAQTALLDYAEREWDSLQSDSGTLEALSNTAFVTTSAGIFATPKDLYDPSVPLLAGAFAGSPVFPTGKFAEGKWLTILKAAGLKQTLDKDSLFKAVERVAQRANAFERSQQSLHGNLNINNSSSWTVLMQAGDVTSSTSEGLEIWESALSLAKHLAQEGSQLLTGSEGRVFAERLSKIPFIPSYVYQPGCVVPGRALCTYTKILLPADWPLAWSVLPTIEDKTLVPPQEIRSALGIRSPPVFNSVAEHLHLVGNDGEGRPTLAHWPTTEHTPESACERLLQYADAEGLSETRLQRLKGAAFVPVSNATRYAAPSHMFVRMPVDARPLLDEVSTEFVSHVGMLKSLGTRDTPTVNDLVSCLRRFLDRRLSTSELLCVARILKYLALEAPNAEVKQAVARGLLLLPTARGILSPSSSCAFSDKGRNSEALAARLPSSVVKLVHPVVPLAACKALGIPSISEIITEQLDPSLELITVSTIQGTTVDSVKMKLREKSFAAAVFMILDHHRRALQEEDAVVDSNGGGANFSVRGPCCLEDAEEVLKAASEQLEFVKECRTVLQAKRGAGQLSMALENSSSEVPFYVDAQSKKIILSAAASSASLPALTSAALSRLLGASVTLPLATLLEASADRLVYIASILTGQSTRFENSLGQGTVDSQNMSSAAVGGRLGSELTASDASLATLSPLRPFAAGELVAYRMPTGALRYGKVPTASRPSSGSTGVYRLTVEIRPGVFHDLLSSEVLSFQPSKTVPNLGVDAANSAIRLGNEGTTTMQIDNSSGVFNNNNNNDRNSIQPAQEGSSTGGVSANELINAAQSMLAAAGVPLEADTAQLMEQIASIKRELHSAKEQLTDKHEESAEAAERAEEIAQTWQCRICLSKEVDTALSSCGHLLCGDCAALMPSSTCPFCRKHSRGVIKLYK